MLDSPSELLERIRLGEDSCLELKEARVKGSRLVAPSRDDLADELAAMANAAGGVLVLGVHDKSRDITGVLLEALDHAEQVVREVCFDSIRPPLACTIVRLALPDALGRPQPILKVDVPRSVFVHKSPGGYLYRIGSSRREMQTEYLARLLQQRSQARLVSFDEFPVGTTGWDDLDWAALGPFLPEGVGQDRSAARKVNVVTERDGREFLTVAGTLLFAERPQAHLPNAVIDAVQYRGTRLDSNYQEDALLCDGQLARQIDEAVAFVLRRQKVRAVKQPDRVETPEYDARSVFEAVTNAVVHRDYSIGGSKIRLFLFDDRLELHVPGALPNSVTVDTLTTRQATRNELIVRFLSRMPVRGQVQQFRRLYVEARGEGVPLILERSRQLSGREPTYQMEGEELRLTVFAAAG